MEEGVPSIHSLPFGKRRTLLHIAPLFIFLVSCGSLTTPLPPPQGFRRNGAEACFSGGGGVELSTPGRSLGVVEGTDSRLRPRQLGPSRL